MIRNPDDKELKYIQPSFGPTVRIIQDGKKSSPMLIFLSRNRPPGSTVLFHIVDNCEQCGQQNIVQFCHTAGSGFLAV